MASIHHTNPPSYYGVHYTQGLYLSVFRGLLRQALTYHSAWRIHNSSPCLPFHTVSNHHQSNPYVMVYALDFSKAVDSVRHSAVLDIFSSLSISDHIYKLIEVFFRYYS